MNTFSSLIDFREGKSPSAAQRKARAEFPKQVSRSRLSLRKPCAPIPDAGKQIILGVASYAADELALLDKVEDSLAAGANGMCDVEVFDVLDCTQMSDFGKFIPGIAEVYRTPVIGVIRDGNVMGQATGLPDVEDTLRRCKLLSD